MKARSLLNRLKHAFAVDPPGHPEPTAEQRAVADALCREIVRRRLATPALAFLEMSRPLNWVSAQVLHAFGPMLSLITDRQGHRHFAEFLEHRGSIDYLCSRIEQLEAAADSREAEPSSYPRGETADDADERG